MIGRYISAVNNLKMLSHLTNDFLCLQRKLRNLFISQWIYSITS